MKLVIARIERSTTDKDGNQLINSKGKPYTRLSLTSGNKKYSGFGGDWNEDWKAGDVVEVRVEENGKYLNIFPLESKPASTPLAQVEQDMSVMHQILAELKVISSTLELILKK